MLKQMDIIPESVGQVSFLTVSRMLLLLESTDPIGATTLRLIWLTIMTAQAFSGLDGITIRVIQRLQTAGKELQITFLPSLL